VDIPWQPSQEDYQCLVDKCLDLLTDKPKDVIDGLSEMTDERALAASGAIASMVSPSYISRPQLYPVVVLTGVVLTVEYGYFPWSAFFISHIGSTLWMIKKLDTPADHVLEALYFITQMHQVSLKMIQKPIFTPSRSKVYEAVTLTGAFCQPLKDLIELAQTGYRSGFETGDILFGGFNALHCSILDLYDGMNLEEYRSQQIEYTQELGRFDQSTCITYISLYLQIATNFIEPFGEPHRLLGNFFDEDVFLPAAEVANDASGRHILYTYKLMLGYHFDQDNKLLELIDECERFSMGAPGLITLAITQLYSALSKLRLYPSLAPENQKEALSQVDQSLRMMEIWSRSVPSTFQPSYDLMAAEKARVTGDLEGALTHYEQAITGARENGFTHDEALANELYARFWAERDNDRFAGPLMREAHSLYLKWGALAKAEHLTKCYPKWLINQSIVLDEPVNQSISDQGMGDLDLHTVLKASRAIAGEIALDKLLAKMMHIVIENAGAQNGFLILARGDEWIIEAIAEVDKSKVHVLQSISIETNEAVSAGIIHYVARTQETIVLADAANEGDFTSDDTIQNRQSRSVLCKPLINQGRISAILYLENNLTTGAFTTERVELLKLLSSEMAMALDNAQVYRNLEQSEKRFRATFEQAAVGIAHVSPEGKFLRINQKFCDIVGYSREEMLQQTFQNITYPDDLDADLGQVNQLLAGVIETYSMDKRYVCKNEELVWVNLTVALVRSETGQPQWFVLVVNDITERKKAEELLRRREAILQAVTYAAEHFLKVPSWEDNIDMVLAHLGQAAEVSRVYVFENHTDAAGELLANQHYEWVAPGVTAQLDNPNMQGISWSSGAMRRAAEIMDSGGFVSGHVRDFLPAEQEMMSAQDIKSMVTVPIFASGEWWGFMGFDECVCEREWFAGEIEALTAGASTLGAAIHRKKAEEALKKSEARLVEAQRTAHLGEWEWDIVKHEVHWSAELYKILDVDPDEIKPSKDTFIKHVHPDDRRYLEELISTILSNNEPFSVDHRIIQPSSGTIRFLHSEARVEYDAENKPVRLVGIAQDITERKLAEDALQKSEKRFSDVADNALEWIWEVDTNGKYIYVSPAVERILGYKPKEILQKHFYDLFYPEDKEELNRATNEAFGRKEAFHEFINRNVHKNGKVVWLSTSGLPIIDETGELIGYRGADTDITFRL